MAPDPGSGPGSGKTPLFLLAGTALLWRLAVLAALPASPALGETPSGAEQKLLFAAGVMGLGFLLCGVLALARATSAAAPAFALYAIATSVHWGGPVAASAQNLQTVIWVAYFSLSMLGQAAFLHFALVYPRPVPWAASVLGRPLYAPAALVALVGAAATMLPAPAVLGLFLTAAAIGSNLYALAGLLVIAARTARAHPRERQEGGLTILLLGTWGALLPWALAELVPNLVPGGLGAQPLTLLFILTPATICTLLLRRRHSQ